MVHSGKCAQIGFGGSGEKDWEDAGHRATFRFSEKRYREHFIEEAQRLLSGHWELGLPLNDYDPASPQSEGR
jgi:hypothetical protein